MPNCDVLVKNLAAMYKDTKESTELFTKMWVEACLHSHGETSNNFIVRVACNEANNVITTAPGSATPIRGFIIYLDMQLFPGYVPMGLSKNSACLKSGIGQDQCNLPRTHVNS